MNFCLGSMHFTNFPRILERGVKLQVPLIVVSYLLFTAFPIASHILVQ